MVAPLKTNPYGMSPLTGGGGGVSPMVGNMPVYPGTGPSQSTTGENWYAQTKNLASEPGSTMETPTTTGPGGRRKKRKARRAARQGQGPAPIQQGSSGGRGGGRGGGQGQIQPPAPSSTGGMPGNAPGGTAANVGAPGGGFSAGGQAGIPSVPLDQALGNPSGPYQETLANNPSILFAEMTGMQNAPGAFSNQWYGSHYNPHDLATALGKGTTQSDILNFGASMARQVSGQGGLGFAMDPRAILGTLFQQAMQIQPGKAPGGPSTPLTNMAYQDPAGALKTFMTILDGALGSTIPQDTYSSLVNTINAIGMEYVMKWGHLPPEDEAKQGGGIIRYIAQRLGPSFGL